MSPRHPPHDLDEDIAVGEGPTIWTRIWQLERDGWFWNQDGEGWVRPKSSRRGVGDREIDWRRMGDGEH